MLIKKITMSFLLAITCIFLSISTNVYSADAEDNKVSSNIPYKLLEISGLSRYSEDRIIFQHIQLPGFSRDEDNSIASLMIIKNDEIFLFRDGFDDIKRIKFENYLQVIRNEVSRDLWLNKINSKPDFIRIASRRTEKFLNSKEEYTEKNSGDTYRSVRDSFLAYHVKVFRELMMNRAESDFKIERNPIYPPAFKEFDANVKFSSVIKAKAMNDYYYYAEDKDGDEITETFYVTMKDSFNWGYNSGPNIVFVYNNKEEDIKKIIGRLNHEAYFGTTEEETDLKKVIPKDTDILKAFNLEKVSISSYQPAKQAGPAADQK